MTSIVPILASRMRRPRGSFYRASELGDPHQQRLAAAAHFVTENVFRGTWRLGVELYVSGLAPGDKGCRLVCQYLHAAAASVVF